MVMISGLKLPPRIAPVQAVIIPIQQRKEGGYWSKAAELEAALKAAGIRVKTDATDKSPGFKFAEQEYAWYSGSYRVWTKGHRGKSG